MLLSCFLKLFRTTFCDFARSKEFRTTFENIYLFPQNAAKMCESTGGEHTDHHGIVESA